MVEAQQEDGVRDIRERAFVFAVRVVKLCQHLDTMPGVSRILSRQLLRAGTSIGANLEEAQGGQSKADFISKNSIALKEARETSYWLRLLVASELIHESRIKGLETEVEELMRIVGAIIVTGRKVSS